MKILTIPVLRKCISFFLIILMLFHTVGCTYFMVDKVPSYKVTSIYSMGGIHKYFIVHLENETYVLEDISLDSLNLKGNLELVKYPFHYDKNKYSKKYIKAEKNILNEVHIYLHGEAEKMHLGTSEIPLTSIKEIRIIDQDLGKTVASYVVGTYAAAIGVWALVMIIFVLIKGSCPYIYVNDGESFVFEGEVFGGAIAQNLERDDYLPLPSIKAQNGAYRIRISNELKERQYTDLAQLVVVSHPEEQKVLLDKYGQPQLIGNPENPIKVTSFNGENLYSVLEECDKEVFLFNDIDYSKNGIIMKFNKPENVVKGKLVLNGKNTLWFDYLFGEFLSKFGVSYDKWMDKQTKVPATERLQKMVERNFPLSVYVKNEEEWKLIDYLFTIGPLASREFVIPVDMSELTGGEIEIKVETGFMFWELDYAAMDYSEDIDLQITTLNSSLAIGTGSIDWTSALEKADNKYMVQENVGEVTELSFIAPPTDKNHVQTVFLHTRGYYELIRDFKGRPEITELNKFKEPGYFSDFSRAIYMKVIEKDDEIASIKTID